MTLLNYEDFKKINEAIMSAQLQLKMHYDNTESLQHAKENLYYAFAHSANTNDKLVRQTLDD